MNILLVSDFFYPNVGGVEMHIYQLSLRLRKRHKLVILTHAYGDRVGVRYLTCGVKVYYIPALLVADGQVGFPSVYSTFPIFRHIIIREQIQVLHAHQAFSSFALEAITHARTSFFLY